MRAPLHSLKWLEFDYSVWCYSSFDPLIGEKCEVPSNNLQMGFIIHNGVMDVRETDIYRVSQIMRTSFWAIFKAIMDFFKEPNKGLKPHIVRIEF